MRDFREVVVLDFEFQAPDGERPDPLCMVARELVSRRTHCLWQDELRRAKAPPFDTGPGTLVCAFFASAEMGCFIELGWKRPINLLCLHAEDRAATNGRIPRAKGQHSLIMACARRNIPVMVGADKEAARALIMNRSIWLSNEVADIMQYCAADVDATVRLLRFMEEAGEIDWTYALLRGRYTAAVAAMERVGVPIDTELLAQLIEHWASIKLRLIASIDQGYGVYDGTTFKLDRFAAYLKRYGIRWPRTKTGLFSLADDTFRDMAKAYPQLYPLKELRSSLAEMRLSSLTVGTDGFNRCLLSPFGARSGRNTPSNSKFVYGPAVWMRGLIRPPEGFGLAYIDWRAQEVALAAALFGDERMMAAYLTGDVYLGFAKDAGLAPPDATAETHSEIREVCKTLVFLLNYGGGDELLAERLGISRGKAAELKALHQTTYSTFWRGSDATTASAYANRFICSTFGWPLHVSHADRPQSIINYPMQSNGAEMMRIAAIAATEEGIQVAAPVHDAVLILAPLDRLEHDIARMQAIMEKAGAVVTGGMPVFADLKPEMKVLPGGRYRDKRGTKMWDTVLSLLPKPQLRTMESQLAVCATQRAQGPDPSSHQYILRKKKRNQRHVPALASPATKSGRL
jgi:hypothetical protein